MNASERRERLVRILTVRGTTSVKELAEELDVCTRTIMRDIDILSTSRPISTVAGKNGGVFVLNTYGKNYGKMCEYELSLLKKIIDNCEKNTSCTLMPSEIRMLKDIVTFYSESDNKKGKRK